MGSNGYTGLANPPDLKMRLERYEHPRFHSWPSTSHLALANASRAKTKRT
jgi:hypothetical protein